jgi:nicotinamidase-related amidase
MKKALIVIDMQNDYFADGSMALVGMDEALHHTHKLIAYAKEKNHEIFFIQHISMREGATFFLPNSEGVKLHNSFNTHEGTIITKHYPNSFRETSLQEQLQSKKIKDLIICGAMTHMCVDTTVRAGFDLGYRIELISDACATKDLIFQNKVIQANEVHNAFMASFDGAFCRVKSTNQVGLY